MGLLIKLQQKVRDLEKEKKHLQLNLDKREMDGRTKVDIMENELGNVSLEVSNRHLLPLPLPPYHPPYTAVKVILRGLDHFQVNFGFPFCSISLLLRYSLLLRWKRSSVQTNPELHIPLLHICVHLFDNRLA